MKQLLRILSALGIALLAHAGTAAAQSRCVPLSTRTVGWWPLDESSGPVAADRAKTPQNGQHVAGPVVVNGQVGRALQFDLTSYVEAPSAAELKFGTGDFSFDTWIWVGDTAGILSILDKRVLDGLSDVRGYHVFLEFGGLGIQLGDGGYDNFHSGIQLPRQQWIHVAITVDRDDPAGIRFYLNGAEAGTRGNPLLHPGSLDTDAPLRIAGHSNGEPYEGIDGRMDEVALHNIVLSPTQIAKLYTAGAAGRCRF